MINEWFRDRGRSLAWDTIAVVQWDMLVFGSISRVFSELREDEILLSGLRPVEEVASHWYWVNRDQPRNYERYLSFKEHLRVRHGFQGPMLACHFVVACLPRAFLEGYSQMELPELGMIEYRVPTCARLLGIPFCPSKRFETWWYCAPGANTVPWIERVLIPGPQPSLSLTLVLYHLLRREGSRIFHPFVHVFPIRPWDVLPFLFNKRRLTALKERLQKLRSR